MGDVLIKPRVTTGVHPGLWIERQSQGVGCFGSRGFRSSERIVFIWFLTYYDSRFCVTRRGVYVRVLSRNRTNRTHLNHKGHLLDIDTTMAVCTQPNSCSAHEAGGLSSPSLSLKDSWRLPREGLVFSPCWKDGETDVSKGWLQHWWRQP